MQRPLEDRFLMSKEELQAKLMSLMGGRAAEQIIFDREFTGSADDLTKATAIARNMVMRYGMSESFAPVTYESEPSPFLNDAPQGEPLHLSDQTAREIDCEIRQLVANALSQAKEILQQHKPLLEETARQLLTSETLNQIELDQIRTQLTRKALPSSSSDKILSLSR
jgi:cell division protease FtsH